MKKRAKKPYKLRQNLEECEKIHSGCTIYNAINVDYDEIRIVFHNNPIFSFFIFNWEFIINSNYCESMLIRNCNTSTRRIMEFLIQ